MKTVAIIQARMGSERLPGKVLKPLAGIPMLHHVVDRARRIAGVDEVAVATSDGPKDDPLAESLAALRVNVVRGSERDVLARYHKAAHETRADWIMRITADCPLLSPTVSALVLAQARDCDYVSNVFPRTYPRGLDTEVFTRAALDAAHREATEPSDREHVTAFIHRQPGRFRLRNVADPVDRHDLRWTVDEPADFDLVSRIYEALYREHPRFDYADVLTALERHPEWRSINRHVEQKKI